ncbi:MAG: hypothetical protein JNM98_18470 [Rhodocyclaceae bacterium]|nr:hypothetical protein [Rhodocyclaceae bacterium]
MIGNVVCSRNIQKSGRIANASVPREDFFDLSACGDRGVQQTTAAQAGRETRNKLPCKINLRRRMRPDPKRLSQQCIKFHADRPRLVGVHMPHANFARNKTAEFHARPSTYRKAARPLRHQESLAGAAPDGKFRPAPGWACCLPRRTGHVAPSARFVRTFSGGFVAMWHGVRPLLPPFQPFRTG